MNNQHKGISLRDLFVIVICLAGLYWLAFMGGGSVVKTAILNAAESNSQPNYSAPAAQNGPVYPARPTALPADPQSDAVATAAQANVGGVPPLPPPLYIDPDLHNGDAVAATADASTHQIYAWDIQRSQAHITNYFNILDVAKQTGDNEAIRAYKNLISLDLSNIENNKSFLPPGAVPGLDEYIAKTRERLASY